MSEKTDLVAGGSDGEVVWESGRRSGFSLGRSRVPTES